MKRNNKGTSIGRNPQRKKTMNKHKEKNLEKVQRGQGK